MPGLASCLALQLVPLTAAARAHTHPLGAPGSLPPASTRGSRSPRREGAAASGRYGLRPQDLASAYRLPVGVAPARAQTIAIVDAYDDPGAERDLAVYDSEFGLPPCTSANGCFRKLTAAGTSSPLPSVEGEWAMEIGLDVETAHAVCQACRIVLIEAASPAFADLEAAEQRAAKLGATEISNSWGGEEPRVDSEAFNHPGIAITAAAGDFGYRNWDGPQGFTGFTDYPASSPHVVAVGGTRLALGATGAWNSERVWNGHGATGGGCSERFSVPAWQRSLANWRGVGCGSTRAVADIAADADPYTGVAVYDSTPLDPGEPAPSWVTLGGTSLASPIIAATFALADGVHSSSGYGAQTLYEAARAVPASVHTIESGSNGECRLPLTAEGVAACTPLEEAASCAARAICLAGTGSGSGNGYSGPAGLGTPDGLCAFETPNTCIPGALGGEEGGAPPSGPAGRAGPPTGQAPGVPGETGSAAGGAGSTMPAAQPSASPLNPAGTPTISHLSLTMRALAALHRTQRAASAHGVALAEIAFAFVLSGADRVAVSVDRLVRHGGRARWRRLRGAFVLSAHAGRNRGHLRGAGTLPAGRYRLTLQPSGGRARSLALVVG
jgi:hypothetical protein